MQNWRDGKLDCSIGVVIPTYNAGSELAVLLEAVNNQTFAPARKIIIDSSSDDDTVRIAEEKQWETIVIPKEKFGHGKTRQQAVQLLQNDVDFIIFLTQDVVIKDKEAFKNIMGVFSDERIGAAYGRQLPKENASFEARLLREFNYPSFSSQKFLTDITKYGIKTAFLSDSFAAYRVEALKKIGGFPVHVNMSEDMYVGAKMLLENYGIAYVAEAEVYHSHNFTLAQHWKRYEAIGEFHRQEKWLLDTFGKSEGEGIKLLKTMLETAVKEREYMAIPWIIIGNAIKYIGYLKGKSGI